MVESFVITVARINRKAKAHGTKKKTGQARGMKKAK